MHTIQTALADALLLVDPAIHKFLKSANVRVKLRDLDCDPISHKKCRAHRVIAKCMQTSNRALQIATDQARAGFFPLSGDSLHCEAPSPGVCDTNHYQG